MQLIRNALMVGLVATLAACSSVPDKVKSLSANAKPYRIDVVQGNVVTREQLAAVQAGMTRNNVQDILGSPLLTSVFRADRWDYVFTFRRQNEPEQSRRVTIWFKADKVDHIDADSLPSEKEFVATLKSLEIKGPLPALTAPADKLPPRTTSTASTANDAAATASESMPVAPNKSYPPLDAVSQ